MTEITFPLPPILYFSIFFLLINFRFRLFDITIEEIPNTEQIHL